MLGIAADVFIVFLLIMANGFLSMSEMALVTARRSRLQDWVKLGNRKAKVALEIAEQPNEILPAVQIGLTLLGMVAGIFSSRTIAEALVAPLSDLSFAAPYSRPLGMTF